MDNLEDSCDLIVLTEPSHAGIQASPRSSSQTKQEPSPTPQEELRPNSENFPDNSSNIRDVSSIIYQFSNRKLKLTAHRKKPMWKSLEMFAKHRGLDRSKLVFRLKESGELVDGRKTTGEYSGKLVLVTHSM